jgi:hypothetical protein
VSVKEEFKIPLRESVIRLSATVRRVVVKTQLFVNFYFLEHTGVIHQYCFAQNFFYSMMQLVTGRQITSNTDKIPDDMESCWERYCSNVLEAGANPTEILQNPGRISDVLTEACVVMATAYTNHIAENFDTRITAYIEYKVKQAYPVIVQR